MMRRTWRTITGLAAGLALTTGALVAAPAVSANGVPAQPTITGVTVLPQAAGTAANAGKVKVAWTGDALTTDDTWIVTASPGNLTTTVPGTGSTTVNTDVSGLTLGTAYTFTVTGVNASGAGTASAPSTPPVIPYATPNPPTAVTVIAGNAQVAVSWTAPANTGGVPITSYTATAALVSNPATTSTCTPTPTTGTSCIIDTPALANNSQYSVTVTATNQGTAGSTISAASNPGVLVTPTATSGLPSAPTGAVAADQVAGKTIEVSFSPNSTSPTGFPVRDYRATCTSTTQGATASVTGTNTSSPIQITTGTPTAGATYTCRVQARNDNGFSGNSVVSNPVTMNADAVLGAPTIGAASGGAGAATVRWTAPAVATGLTGYQVAYNSGSGWSLPVSVAGTAASTVLALPAGSYNFQVRALNSGGAGTWSSVSNPAVTVTAGTLNAPTAVTGTPGVGEVTLVWTAPTGGTLAPTSYRVQYSTNNGTSWTILDPTGSTSTTARVTNLANGTPHVFQVQAINSDVASAWSTSSAPVSPGTPGLPTDLVGTAGNAQVVLTWKAPAAATGVPVPTGYEVQYQVSGTTTWLPSTPLTATALSRTVTGLTNGTAYVFRIRAVNGSTVDPDAVSGAWTTTNPTVTPVAPLTSTIEIAGERGTGKNRIRIYVDGVTTGLAAGTKLVPQFRFPGQRGFTSGTARPEVDEDGFFTWSRKAGKQIVIRFATESGDVRSEPVKIPARR